MAKSKVLHTVDHDGVRYEKGQTFEADKDTVDQLIAAGALRDPNAPKEDESVDSDAKAEADALVAEAETTLADAKTEAEKIKKAAQDDADKTAEAAKVEGDKIVADAKTEAEKIKKAAQSK